MTDNDIIKALECCKIKTPPYKCEECPLLRGVSNSCIYECKELAYNLINRLKTEIDILCNSLDVSSQNIENMARAMPNIAKATRHAAIKEFAKKLKIEAIAEFDDDNCFDGFSVAVEDIDNLVKEMTEGEDDKTE